jgi:hypothetical protein
MASTTGNQKEFPKVLQNGVNNPPDATELMANYDMVNDKIYICTEAEIAVYVPYVGQHFFVTDCDVNICKRVYTSDGWYVETIAKLG